MKPGLTLLFGLGLGLSVLAQDLPPPVRDALQAARLPTDALGLWVAPLDAPTEPRLRWRETALQNPASLSKLVSSLAALELLGPSWRWRTPVWIQGRLDPASGVLEGDVLIAGRGDPSLVLERLWLLLAQLQQRGVRELRGDFVLDNQAFAADEQHPADFDGEPWRPGNVRPDALLLNFKSWTLNLRPDPARQLTWLSSDLPLALAQDRVPIRPGACLDPRGALRANWALEPGKPQPLRLDGHWPSACGEQRWPIADADPTTFNARLLAGMWQAMGGKLNGRVRNGIAPLAEAPSFEWQSPQLAELLRDINKYSNNLMAEQLGLTLALQGGQSPADTAGARQLLARWLQQRLGWAPEAFVWDRASGLSRQTRLSAHQLAQLLQLAWDSPVMPEFVASLPLAGRDGTLAREPGRFGEALGRAHLKTGSLRDVQAIAGYLQARSGRRYVLVAMLQHPQAQGPGARAVLDALLRWAVVD
jgi:D-alanyl-D-alanine carboxypeptidase/D-alanyl-D-alanine-endopeptidase (penicillin-binding protein 4)